ncbi:MULTISPECIES: RcnB family protein [unclassified Pseudomonas]|uniref:RcnB family protein n=1 Tax=unclassified Pseudomonas TaxID=196821 RepID=UPI0028D29FB4|nr:RcnB family protein [uncultured Pseudomonas sp.]
MRNVISASILACLMGAVPFAAQAANQTPRDCKADQILVKSMDKFSCYGIGDKAPDQFIRDKAAIKDWKSKKLTKPVKDEQWVQIGNYYVLVNGVNNVIKEIRTKNGKVVSK